jgi:hypothetical protein
MPPRRNYFAAAILMLVAMPVLSAGDDDNWIRIKLDERFRSEGVAAADLNNDGTPDVIAGDVWYEGAAGRFETAPRRYGLEDS